MHILYFTLAISDEAGLETLGLVTSLGPVSHWVREAGQLGGWERGDGWNME